MAIFLVFAALSKLTIIKKHFICTLSNGSKTLWDGLNSLLDKRRAKIGFQKPCRIPYTPSSRGTSILEGPSPSPVHSSINLRLMDTCQGRSKQ